MEERYLTVTALSKYIKYNFSNNVFKRGPKGKI